MRLGILVKTRVEWNSYELSLGGKQPKYWWGKCIKNMHGSWFPKKYIKNYIKNYIKIMLKIKLKNILKIMLKSMLKIYSKLC